jgi:hypothetical protein
MLETTGGDARAEKKIAESGKPRARRAKTAGRTKASEPAQPSSDRAASTPASITWLNQARSRRLCRASSH